MYGDRCILPSSRTWACLADQGGEELPQSSNHPERCKSLHTIQDACKMAVRISVNFHHIGVSLDGSRYRCPRASQSDFHFGSLQLTGDPGVPQTNRRSSDEPKQSAGPGDISPERPALPAERGQPAHQMEPGPLRGPARVLDSARSLTGANCGAFVLLDCQAFG